MRRISQGLLVVWLLVNLVCAYATAEPTGTLSVTVRETDGREPLPCRAWVVRDNQRHFRPTGDSCAVYERDLSFSSDGRFSLPLPAGKAVVHLERGKEYLPVDEPVTIEDGRTTEVTITVQRWIDMAKEGWYSADFHAHHIGEDRRVLKPDRAAEDVRILKQLGLADDVNWLPAFSYWNNNIESWPDWPTGREIRADATHLVTLTNEEIERIAPADGETFTSRGAPLLFGLSKPVYFPRLDATYPCDAILCRAAKAQSPRCIIDTDKSLWAENVVGVALGLFDAVQVCHNHYHRDKTFRMGWGMIGPDLEGGPQDCGKNELLIRTNRTYYRWLNCGFRLAATGGSAIGVMPVPLGYSRTYAKLDGPFSEESYLDAVRAGRTFATTGPMLFLSVDGREPGTRIECSSKEDKPLRIRTGLRTIQPITSIEVIVNGEVFHTLPGDREPAASGSNQVLEVTLKPQRSGWVAARATFPCPDGSLHQAHTSPIYVAVDGKPTAFKRDAEYMIRWIDRLLQISERPDRYASQQDRRESQSVFREARRVYETTANTAASVWHDQ